MKIEVYDTTLRDGEQTPGVTYTLRDKLHIIAALDRFGADYIEIGNFNIPASASHTRDRELFAMIETVSVTHARLCAFGSTRHANTRVEENRDLTEIAASAVPVITIVGKSAISQVETVLHTTPQENLSMIADTISFLKAAGKEVIFDAEHYFDGYSDAPSYAFAVIRTAVEAGADTIVLCDTNGGMMPDVIGMIMASTRRRFPNTRFGIHCHNDMGMAVADTVQAVLEGAVQFQATVSGMGERCGNANLETLIPLLQLKLGFSCVPPERLRELSSTVRYINEIANLPFSESEPFVGGYAFSHKAGMHIDGVRKAPTSFEHIDPTLVGNSRNLLISSMAGRTAIWEKAALIRPDLDRNSPEIAVLMDKVRQSEERGFQYENAEASLFLLMLDAFGMRRSFYHLENYQITINESAGGGLCTASVKISVGEQTEITAAEGTGPVGALDTALRKALLRFFPQIASYHLTDYKVRVIDSESATNSCVRVLVESTDGVHVWRTVGVSPDIVDASWQALSDALEYRLHDIAL